MLTKHLIITGRVQGVGFRYYVEYRARQFHITGWVRNHQDGSVEAMTQGTPENVEAMIVRAHRGPPHSAVANARLQRVGHLFGGRFTAFLVYQDRYALALVCN